jgi:hypothetical protein
MSNMSKTNVQDTSSLWCIWEVFLGTLSGTSAQRIACQTEKCKDVSLWCIWDVFCPETLWRSLGPQYNELHTDATLLALATDGSVNYNNVTKNKIQRSFSLVHLRSFVWHCTNEVLGDFSTKNCISTLPCVFTYYEEMWRSVVTHGWKWQRPRNSLSGSFSHPQSVWPQRSTRLWH